DLSCGVCRQTVHQCRRLFRAVPAPPSNGELRQGQAQVRLGVLSHFGSHRAGLTRRLREALLAREGPMAIARAFALLALSGLLADCNTLWAGNPNRTNDIGVGIKTPPPSAPASDQITFDCEGGKSFTALFDNEKNTVTVTFPGTAPITMPIEVTG